MEYVDTISHCKRAMLYRIIAALAEVCMMVASATAAEITKCGWLGGVAISYRRPYKSEATHTGGHPDPSTLEATHNGGHPHWRPLAYSLVRNVPSLRHNLTYKDLLLAFCQLTPPSTNTHTFFYQVSTKSRSRSCPSTSQAHFVCQPG